MSTSYSFTKDTPPPTRYRGQRFLVLQALTELKGKAELEALVKKVGPDYHKTFKVHDGVAWTDTNYGGIRGSVIYHLRALVKDGFLKQDGDAPVIAKAVKKAEAAPKAA